MKVLALDISLRATGYCLAGPSLTWGTLPPPAKMNGMERINWIVERVKGLASGVGFVVMEGLAQAANFPGKADRVKLAGLIEHWLWVNQIPFGMCAPTSLKKFVVGRGGSKNDPVGKDLILKEVYKRFHADCADNNQADAVGLCYVGLAALGCWEPTSDAQREVVAVFRKNNAMELKQVRQA